MVIISGVQWIHLSNVMNQITQVERCNIMIAYLKNQTVFDLDSHKLSIGGQYRYEDLHDQGNQLPTAANFNKLTRWSWALFSEDEWTITSDFSLTAGIRMDKDENFGSHWTPRLYGVWHINDQWILKGGVSTGYRSPDLRQVAPNWGQISGGQTSKGIILGNPNLKPEKYRAGNWYIME